MSKPDFRKLAQALRRCVFDEDAHVSTAVIRDELSRAYAAGMEAGTEKWIGAVKALEAERDEALRNLRIQTDRCALLEQRNGTVLRAENVQMREALKRAKVTMEECRDETGWVDLATYELVAALAATGGDDEI